MEKFVKLTTRIVPLPVEDVDTDQIIPARFLKATSREGFGENLFRDWRFDQNGNPKKELSQRFGFNNKLELAEQLIYFNNFYTPQNKKEEAQLNCHIFLQNTLSLNPKMENIIHKMTSLTSFSFSNMNNTKNLCH